MNIPEEAEPRIRLGVLVRPFGTDGLLRCLPAGEIVPRVLVPCTAWIGFTERFLSPVRLVSCAPHGGALICGFEGVASRNASDELVDRALYVAESSLIFDTPYAHPGLVGAQVLDESGQTLGEIVSIGRTRAHDLWTVRCLDGEERMIPAVEAFVVKVDRAARVVTVRTIPGLLEDLA